MTHIPSLHNMAKTVGSDIIGLTWSQDRLHEGLALLVSQAGLSSSPPVANEGQPLIAPPLADPSAFDQWLPATSYQLGCDVQAVDWQFSDIKTLVQRLAPALLRIPNQSEPRFLLMLQGGAQWVVLLAPNHQRMRISVAKLSAFLQAQTASKWGEMVEQLLRNTGVVATRMAKAKTALIAEQMGNQRFEGCWLLKVSAQRSTWHHLRHHHLVRYLFLLVALGLLQQLITIVSWRYIGQGVFQSDFTTAGLAAWALLLLTAIPFSLLANWAQINIILNFSRFARTRLLQGILNLNPSTIRHLGAGQFLERVMQTESFQNLLLSGGFSAINALIQIAAAAFILRMGVGGTLHSMLLVVWLLLTIGLSIWYARLFIGWRQSYRALTNDLVERMVAHRTRLAQEDKTTWHLKEDQQLDRYQMLTRRLDHWQRLLNTFLNRGWFLVGLAGIALPFINGADQPIPLAISIGGILLASAAFSTLRSAIVTLADIYVTWREIAPIFQAAAQPQAVGQISGTPTTQAGNPLLVARNVQFRYHAGAPLTLRNVDLTIRSGERVLLEGPSGGGKSTLASLLVGLQQADHGLLLLHGWDQSTMGLAQWRHLVVSAPQFHENHVLTESFGFNLLMGRRWPATPDDLQAAEQICRELGLGDLLERMPGSMMQMVGESGWQLSHGERSRLFIARALLQKADLIVLDESFAALDPTNLERAIRCVLRRAPTLLVIAHP